MARLKSSRDEKSARLLMDLRKRLVIFNARPLSFLLILASLFSIPYAFADKAMRCSNGSAYLLDEGIFQDNILLWMPEAQKWAPYCARKNQQSYWEANHHVCFSWYGATRNTATEYDTLSIMSFDDLSKSTQIGNPETYTANNLRIHQCKELPFDEEGYPIVPVTSNNAKVTYREYWLRGFGPINFGDYCTHQDSVYESYEYEGFELRAHCFTNGVPPGRITRISLSHTELSFDAAKTMILKRIKQIEPSVNFSWETDWTVEILKGANERSVTLVHDWKPDWLGKGCKGEAPTAVKISNYEDTPTNRGLNLAGKLEISISAPRLFCKEQKLAQEAAAAASEKKKRDDLSGQASESLLNGLR